MAERTALFPASRPKAIRKYGNAGVNEGHRLEGLENVGREPVSLHRSKATVTQRVDCAWLPLQAGVHASRVRAKQMTGLSALFAGEETGNKKQQTGTPTCVAVVTLCKAWASRPLR
jgi:hypothetical protein